MGSILSNCDFQLPQTNFTNPNQLRVLKRYYDEQDLAKMGLGDTDTVVFKKSPASTRRRLSSIDDCDSHQNCGVNNNVCGKKSLKCLSIRDGILECEEEQEQDEDMSTVVYDFSDYEDNSNCNDSEPSKKLESSNDSKSALKTEENANYISV